MRGAKSFQILQMAVSVSTTEEKMAVETKRAELGAYTPMFTNSLRVVVKVAS